MIVKSYTAQIDSINNILKDIREFVLKSNKKRKDIMEYELLSEELLLKLIEASEPGEELTIGFKKRIANSDIVISCKGAPIYIDEEHADLSTKIIMDYSERIRHTRMHGINQITVSLETATDSVIRNMNIAGFSAILTSIVICLFMESSQIDWLSQQVFHPVMMLFIKLLQGVATPVAFISLLSYVIDFHASYEFNGKMKKVALKYIATSILATIIPFIIITLTDTQIIGDTNGNIGGLNLNSNETIYVLGKSAEEIIGNLLPENLIEIFKISNPLPMLLIAGLLGIVINSYDGKMNYQIRNGIRAIYDLLSRIISFVFSLLPFFLYFALVGMILQDFRIHKLAQAIKVMCFIAAFVFAMLIVQCIIYIIEIKLAGISIKAFFAKYKDMILENFRIGSNVDALPYNMRMFRRKLNNPKKESTLRSILSLGTNVNMDGNCVIITTIIMLLCMSMNFKPDFLFLLEILVIILLLGIGSPNQPGSFTISMLVLMGFLNLSNNLCYLLIIFESVFFRFYSTINTFGDIVTVVITEDDELKKRNILA